MPYDCNSTNAAPDRLQKPVALVTRVAQVAYLKVIYTLHHKKGELKPP